MRSAWISIALLTGCHGVIGDIVARSDPPVLEDGESPPVPAGTRARKRLDHPCETHTARAVPLRRLTRTQYDHAIRDLFAPADVGRYGDRFPGDARTAAFATNNSGGISDAHYEAYLAAAETIAPIAARAFTDMEASAVINTVGRRAFRRPIDPEEHDRLLAIYDAEVARGDHQTGLELIIQAILQSPSFLYRHDAAELSFVLWDSIPDESSDENPRDVASMLADDRARDGSAAFFLQWLGVSESESLAAFTDRAERFDTLLRTGLLIQPDLLATHSHRNQTSPVKRGKLIRENFLCDSMPPPPPNVNDNPPDLDPNLTTRERFAEHAQNPECAGCHQLMDPIGLGFEGYDELGRRRSEEGGRPIDESGRIVDTADIDGAFNGVAELSEKLATSVQVKECVVDNWFTFTFGRIPDDRDLCTLFELDDAFERSSLRDLVTALATEVER